MNRITSTLNSFITFNNAFITFCIVLYFCIMAFVPNTAAWKTLFAFGFPVAFYFLGFFVKILDFSKEGLPATLLILHLPLMFLSFIFQGGLDLVTISAFTSFILGKAGVFNFFYA